MFTTYLLASSFKESRKFGTRDLGVWLTCNISRESYENILQDRKKPVINWLVVSGAEATSVTCPFWGNATKQFYVTLNNAHSHYEIKMTSEDGMTHTLVNQSIGIDGVTHLTYDPNVGA